jgi:hypothetical protein
MDEMSKSMKYHFGGGVPVWYRDAENNNPHMILSFLHGLRLGLMAYAWWKDGVQYVGTCGHTLARALAVVDAEVKRIEVKQVEGTRSDDTT